MNKVNERIRLIEELKNIPTQAEGFILTTPERLADYILADRLRIVGPLIELKEALHSSQHPGFEQIDEAIKLAGLERKNE